MKRNLILAVMITFCFAASIFMAIPIQSARVYNPNADINHDGAVNLSDLVLLANSYSATGDPTLPVNISEVGSTNVTGNSLPVTQTNPPYAEVADPNAPIMISYAANTPSVFVTSYPFSVTGYSTLYINIHVLSMNAGTATLNVTDAYWSYQQYSPSFDEQTPTGYDSFSISSAGGASVSPTYQATNMAPIMTKAPYVTFSFTILSSTSGTISFNYWVYMRSD